MKTMKRVIGSCGLASIGQRCRQARRSTSTLSAQNAGQGMVGDEEERNYGPASPPLKDPGNLSPMFTVPPHYGNSQNSLRDPDAGDDGHLQSSSRLARSSPYGMNNRHTSADENYLRYPSSAGIKNPLMRPLDGDLPRGERQSAVSWQRAEAESSGVATSSQKQDTPVHKDIKSHSHEYNIQKARIHANLWQEEIQKHFGEATSVERNADSGLREGGDWDPRKKVPQDWESLDPAEDFYPDENPAKEEVMMLEEFEKRRERNRIQITSFVKQHLYGRRRPVDGWKYILNNFGKDGKGSRGSAFGGEAQTTGSELEKLAFKRESARLRRKN